MAPTHASPRILYIVTEDWYFLSHRLPMARAARDAGFEVHVATNIGDSAAQIEREGFTVHPVPFARGRVDPFANLTTILALRYVQRHVAPAITHRVAMQATVVGAIAAIGLGGKSVNAITGLGHAFIAGNMKAKILRGIIGLVLRRLVDRPGHVALVQNPDDGALLKNLGLSAERIVLIPGSGVDIEKFHTAPEPPAPITIGFAGRLLEDKGIRTLVAAHRKLRADGFDVNLLIAGTRDPANPTSVTEAELAQWKSQPGLSMLGHVSDISTLWAQSHIAVLASRREGLPKSLLEAAACGRPMVATDVPGCREIVRPNETGVLVPADDADALASAIGRLALSGDMRHQFGRAARDLVAARFSSRAVGQATVDLYRRLADKAA
jgi:glycosyltransferase involved in cell wall biosynthesis